MSKWGSGAKVKILPLLVWFSLSLLSYAVFCAELDYSCRSGFKRICDQNMARENMSVSAMLSIAGPISLVVATGVSGFWQHGLRFDVRPAFLSEVKP